MKGLKYTIAQTRETVALAKQIEQDLRVRRIVLNNGWIPDWSNFAKPKYFVFMYENQKLDIEAHYSINSSPVFGYFESLEKAKQFVDEQREELEWYFTEYISVRDELELLLVEV